MAARILSLTILSLMILCAAGCEDANRSEKSKSMPPGVAADVSLPGALPETCRSALREPGPLSVPEECYTGPGKDFFGAGDEYPTQQYVYVNGAGVRLRAKPGLGSEARVLTTMKLASRVGVLYTRKDPVVIAGKTGRWAFVYFSELGFNEPQEPSAVGWVFDYYLSRPSDFQPVQQYDERVHAMGVVDSLYCLKTKASGAYTFITWTKPEFGGTTKVSGQLYRHRALLWPRNPTGESGEEFSWIYTDRSGELYSEPFYGLQPSSRELYESRFAKMIDDEGVR